MMLRMRKALDSIMFHLWWGWGVVLVRILLIRIYKNPEALRIKLFSPQLTLPELNDGDYLSSSSPESNQTRLMVSA